MRRRDVLKAAGASLAALAAPQIGRGERANKLVFVPTEGLKPVFFSCLESLMRVVNPAARNSKLTT